MEIVNNIWNYIYRFFSINPHIIPINVSRDEYNNFFRTKKALKILYALDNIPYIIHNILFKDNGEISKDYFQIYLHKKNKRFCVAYCYLNNLEKNIQDDDIRFIYIRLNLMTNKIINHVNCLIIDKTEKRIYIFEPQCKLKFDVSILKNNIKLDFISDYDFIEPSRMGNIIIQKNNFYCQTYVIMAFYLITKFYDKIEYDQYYSFLKKYMSSKYLAIFLIHIDKLLDENNIIIGNFKKIKNDKSFILEDDGDIIYIDFTSNTI